MARHTDSVCKLCRREGIKLYLKASRCDSPKCAIERRDQPPGMHWQRRSKPSEYGRRLREKQKLKRFYGVMERQFRRYFALASRSKENTGEKLLAIMERRLDNVLYRLGFALNRAAARQMIGHGHIQLNGHACNIPSLLVKKGDVITVKPRSGSQMLARLSLQQNTNPVPAYLERPSMDPPEGRVSGEPTRGDIDPHLEQIQEQLIIEFCSR